MAETLSDWKGQATLGGLFPLGVHFQRGFNFKQVKYLSTFRAVQLIVKMYEISLMKQTLEDRSAACDAVTLMSDLSGEKRGSVPDEAQQIHDPAHY